MGRTFWLYTTGGTAMWIRATTVDPGQTRPWLNKDRDRFLACKFRASELCISHMPVQAQGCHVCGYDRRVNKTCAWCGATVNGGEK